MQMQIRQESIYTTNTHKCYRALITEMFHEVWTVTLRFWIFYVVIILFCHVNNFDGHDFLRVIVDSFVHVPEWAQAEPFQLGEPGLRVLWLQIWL